MTGKPESTKELRRRLEQCEARVVARQAEAGLRLLTRVFESSTAAIGVADAEGSVTHVNPAFLRMWGYQSADEVVGSTIASFFADPADAMPVMEALGSDGSWDGELVARRADGSTFVAHGLATAVADSAGNVIGYQTALLDVTAEKAATEALRASEERFRTAFEQAAVGMAQVGLDGRWLRVNRRLCDITGYSREELLERTFQELTHPADLETNLENLRGLLAGDIETYSMEKRYVRKDGSTTWVDLTVAPARDDAGSPQYLICVIQDVNDRKRMEEVLRASEQHLNDAQSIARMGDFVLDVETGEVTWSDALYELLGFDRSEAIDSARVRAGIDHPDDADRVRRWIADCVASAEAVLTPNEYRVVRQDGETLWVHTVGVIERDERGAARVFATVQDITERRRSEEALRSYARELTVRNRITDIFLSVADDDMYTRILDTVLDTLESELGVFGYLDERGDLVVPTMTTTVWDECQTADKRCVFARETWGDSA